MVEPLHAMGIDSSDHHDENTQIQFVLIVDLIRMKWVKVIYTHKNHSEPRTPIFLPNDSTSTSLDLRFHFSFISLLWSLHHKSPGDNSQKLSFSRFLICRHFHQHQRTGQVHVFPCCQETRQVPFNSDFLSPVNFI
jgi:hypothetical protein